MPNDKEGATSKKYGLLAPRIEESDTVSLGHGLCVSGGSIYNKNTRQNTLFTCTHIDRSSCPSHFGLKLLKPQISKQHPSKICFITPGWHVTHDLNFIVFDDVDVIKLKREFKKICMQDK
jgi:hypothetical protein